MENAHRLVLVAEDLQDKTSADRRRSQSINMYASLLAQKLHTSVDFTHVENITLFARDLPYNGYIEDQVKRKTKKLAQLRGGVQAKAQTHFLKDINVENALSERARRRHHELIVVGTHGRKGLERLYLGSVAERLVQRSNVPVMVVGPKAQKNSEEIAQKKKLKILLATDLGPSSKKAERYAASLATRLHAELEVFHCVYERFQTAIPITYPATVALPEGQGLWEDVKKNTEKKLLNLQRSMSRKGIYCTINMIDGAIPSSVAILKEIKVSAPTFVVIGTRGRNLLADTLLGGTARKVFRESSVPVITVKSE